MADTASVDFGILAGAGAPTRSYKAGDVIFREGDPAVELFVVKSGSVEIRIRDRLIGTLGERSIFGEMALVDGNPSRDLSWIERSHRLERDRYRISGEGHAIGQRLRNPVLVVRGPLKDRHVR